MARVADEHDERVARRLERFIAVPDGAEVWTRDPAGLFHRGVITGPWRYDTDPAAYDLDLTHVRPCSWEPDSPWPSTSCPPRWPRRSAVAAATSSGSARSTA